MGSLEIVPDLANNNSPFSGYTRVTDKFVPNKWKFSFRVDPNYL